MKKEKLYTKIISTVLITILGITNFLPICSNMALAMTNEELENQSKLTNIKNVEYDAKLKLGDNYTHRKESYINEENTLVLNINVKDKGCIEDAKIKILDSNFDIEREKINSQYIKNIDEKNNILELNKIIYSNDIQIEIPLKIKKLHTFSEDYFAKETIVQLTGKYKENENEVDILSERKVKLEWKQEKDVALTQNIEKYLNLENKILLQQSIKTEIDDTTLPRENEILTINAIELDQTKPEKVSVILNGKKLENNEVNYDINTGIININNDTKGFWSNNINTYKVIYEYANVQFGNKDINLKTTLKAKLYEQEEITKYDEQKLNIQEIGNIVSISKESTNELYKGYLYANSVNETIYEEKNIIEISNYDKINSIEIKTINSYFVDKVAKKYDANPITIFKKISISKENLITYFGKDGYINIKDETGKIISRIDNTTIENDNGIIDINIQEEKTKIILETSKPIQQGEFTIKTTKAIKGNTGYKKSQLKEFIQFATYEEVSTNLSKQGIEGNINLLDTKTDAKLEISNTNLSTLQKNENVQFLVTLNSDSAKYDLFKNPIIYIKIPKEININVKTISQLNVQDELKIESTGIKTLETGEKLLRIVLKGEQANFINSVDKGIQIAFMADLTTENTVPTQNSKIVMEYTNENRANETFTYEQPIKLNSKYGVLVTNNLKEYNSKNDEINNLTENVQIANLDMGTNKKTATGIVNVINNYEAVVENAYVIIETAKISEQANFEVNIKNIKVLGKESKIYYSEENNTSIESTVWKENIEDVSKVRTIKIEIGTILPQKKVTISYNLDIPENLEFNKRTYVKNIVNYNYAKENNDFISTVIMKTEEKENIQNNENNNIDNNVENVIPLQENDEITLGIQAISGENIIRNGDSVKEGQGITYELTLKNNTNKTLNNIKINAVNENAIYYDLVTHQEEINGEIMDIILFEENPKLTSKQMEIEKIEAGQTAKIRYQTSAKEVEGTDKKLTGKIKISADEMQEKEYENISNNIEQAEIKVIVKDPNSYEIPVSSGENMPFELNLKNISGKELNNITLEIPIPEEVEFNIENINLINEKCEFVELTNQNVAKFTISSLTENETLEIGGLLRVKEFSLDKTNIEVKLFATAILNNNVYTSNHMYKNILQSKAEVLITQTTNHSSQYVKDKENITITFKIENNGAIEKRILFYNKIQEALIINQAILELDNQKEELDYSYNICTGYFTLQPKQTAYITINVTTDLSKVEGNKIINEARISGENIDQNSNKIEFIVEDKEKPDNPNPPNPEGKRLSISGEVWLDENENGQKDSNETKMPNIEVILMNSVTGEKVKLSGKEQIVTTNEKGEYIFENIPTGKYTVLFKYDSSKYRVTEYNKENIAKERNSDIISKKVQIDGENLIVGATESLDLENENIINLDAGLIESKVFDFKLDKYVNRVEIQNKVGTTTKEFDKANLAKIEIDAKQLKNSTVIIKYDIVITNEGEIPGYVNEIIDYIPNDLTFDSKKNENWKKINDEMISTNSLDKTLINSGESKTISLVLTKEITEENTGRTINIAEINKAENEYAISDVDSNYGNKKDKEDDISSAELIISIKTGKAITYVIIIILAITILGIGIYYINKKILKK